MVWFGFQMVAKIMVQAQSYYNNIRQREHLTLIILNVVKYRVDITLVYYSVVWLWFFRSYGQKFGPLVFFLFGPWISIYSDLWIWSNDPAWTIWHLNDSPLFKFWSALVFGSPLYFTFLLKLLNSNHNQSTMQEGRGSVFKTHSAGHPLKRRELKV